MRVRANRSEKVTCETQSDPMIGAFLAFIKQQMYADPVLFIAINQAQIALIESLVEGVDAECDTEFPTDFGVPYGVDAGCDTEFPANFRVP